MRSLESCYCDHTMLNSETVMKKMKRRREKEKRKGALPVGESISDFGLK